MNIKIKKWMIISIIGLIIVLIPLIIFNTKAPVLIVAEESFLFLYGEERFRRQVFFSSISIFRPIKNVIIANDAGDDLIPFAVEEISRNPYCVFFPSRLARSADIYLQRNPDTHVVILEGRQNLNFDIKTGYFLYQTDIEADFYRAGLAATAFSSEDKIIALFLELHIQEKAKEAFLRGLSELEYPPEVLFYTSFSDYPVISDLSCVVIAGIGIEYLDEKSDVPVILFTWLDPKFIPFNIVAVIDDSPWAQVVQAVNMVKAGESSGLIKSKFTILNRNNANKAILRKINRI